ncbi:serine hydrolase domain-containing protein [Aureibaculum luteum]|uniref:serine hydrolase domain-containing protein n=1 Tax=Aureibaculum luteum TaxID=1548456 RepID=UPI000E5463EB|nr:serine hydrolase domain-containing protein [Aureibaculum luteum]
MKKRQTKNILRILFIALSIGSLWFVPWTIVKAWVTPLPDTVQEQMNTAIEYGFDGMIVYIDEAGKAPAFYASGLKSREYKIPANPKSLFKIASISKLYVAVSITKLVHGKKISLDETLAHHFPEMVGKIEHADKITLRMMVQHRSGIPNYVDHPKFWDKPSTNHQEALAYAFDMPASFAPDTDYGYSNTNYLLLRELIKKIMGYDHFQYIKEEILMPLGLKNTFGSVNDVNIDDMMSGYYVGFDEDFKFEDQGMVATAEDVGIFIRALNDGSVFKAGEQEIYSSIYEYEHTGLVVGYQSIAKYHKDIDVVVVQFTNTTNFDGYNWNLSEVFYSRIVKIIRKRKAHNWDFYEN